MVKHSVSLSLLAALVVLAAWASTAFAQDDSQFTPPARGMFVTLPAHLHPDIAPPAASLPSWNGSFSYGGSNYTYNMVGTAPSTNTSTTITTYIIPVKIVITARNGSKTTFDPSHVLSNGNTVTTNTVDSPIFDSSANKVGLFILKRSRTCSQVKTCCAPAAEDAQSTSHTAEHRQSVSCISDSIILLPSAVR